MFAKLAKYTKAFILMPYYVYKMHLSIQELRECLDQPTRSSLGRALLYDNNIMFKYASSGIELHPFVKRESDALVADFREASDNAQLRYKMAAEFIKPGEDVLDLSCGYGYGADFLFHQCDAATVVGADRFKPAVEYAKRVFGANAPDVRFEVQDAMNQNAFEGNSFDVVVSLETIEHVKDDFLVILNFRKWLRKNGRLIISVPNENKMQFSPEKHPYHLRHYTVQRLVELCGRAGFTLQETRFFTGAGISDQESCQIFAVFTVDSGL